jgi:methylthioribose-1-phosphate isomerase
LPQRELTVRLTTVDAVAETIRTMRVCGAPTIDV